MGFSLKNIFKDGEEEGTLGNEEEFYNMSQADVMNEANKAGNKMILHEPRAFSEAQGIADHLKNRNTVIVNLKRVTSDQAKRIIDFLSGCIYSIGGSMQKIGVGIYVCTPKNVNVQGKITEEADAKNSKSSVEDELSW